MELGMATVSTVAFRVATFVGGGGKGEVFGVGGSIVVSAVVFAFVEEVLSHAGSGMSGSLVLLLLHAMPAVPAVPSFELGRRHAVPAPAVSSVASSTVEIVLPCPHAARHLPILPGTIAHLELAAYNKCH